MLILEFLDAPPHLHIMALCCLFFPKIVKTSCSILLHWLGLLDMFKHSCFTPNFNGNAFGNSYLCSTVADSLTYLLKIVSRKYLPWKWQMGGLTLEAIFFFFLKGGCLQLERALGIVNYKSFCADSWLSAWIVNSSTFTCSSAGKESTCNVGDLGSISGLGRSPGEGTATQSSILAWRTPWTTVCGVAKSRIWLSHFHSLLLLGLPRWLRWSRIHLQCRRPWFDPWVGKIPLEKGIPTHSNILAWRIPRTEEPGSLRSMGLQRIKQDWATNTFTFFLLLL